MGQKADFSTPNPKNFTKFSASLHAPSSWSSANYGFATKNTEGRVFAENSLRSEINIKIFVKGGDGLPNIFLGLHLVYFLVRIFEPARPCGSSNIEFKVSGILSFRKALLGGASTNICSV